MKMDGVVTTVNLTNTSSNHIIQSNSNINETNKTQKMDTVDISEQAYANANSGIELKNFEKSNPYSSEGVTINRLVSVGYLSGMSKINPEILMAPDSLPNLSGMKINTDAYVFSLSQTETTEEMAFKPQLNSITLTEDIEFIEPLYNLHGVTFTNNEIKIAKEYMEGMTAIMRDNGVFSLTLDYDDYAIMGLGESQICSFGNEQGFTDEQIEALLIDYRDSISALVDKNLKEFPFERQITNLPMSDYFFVNSAEESWIGDYHIKEGTSVSTPDLAVNWKMIRNIYEMMANVNQNSDGSMKNAENKFEEEAIAARRAGMVVPSWAEWRVSVYMDNIAKFDNAADSFRNEINTQYTNLETKA